MITRLSSIIKVETNNSNKLFYNYFIIINIFLALLSWNNTIVFSSTLDIFKIHILFLMLILIPLRITLTKYQKQQFFKYTGFILYIIYVGFNIYLNTNDVVKILLIFSINLLPIIYISNKISMFTSIITLVSIFFYYVNFKTLNIDCFNVLTIVAILCMGLFVGLNRILKIFDDITKDDYNPFLDKATGAYNKHYLEERLKNIPVRGDLELSIISINIDDMKEINKNYGTSSGDAILQNFISTIKCLTRESDSICRIEGDEFVIIVQHPKEFEVVNLAKRIKGKLENSKVAVVTKELNTVNIEIRASFGVGTLKQDENNDMLLERSQKALRLAKRKGKNRIEESE